MAQLKSSIPQSPDEDGSILKVRIEEQDKTIKDMRIQIQNMTKPVLLDDVADRLF